MPGCVFSFFENFGHICVIFGLKFGPKPSWHTGEVVDAPIFFLCCLIAWINAWGCFFNFSNIFILGSYLGHFWSLYSLTFLIHVESLQEKFS